ncbi:MAG: NAD(P)-dependent oxidoreductase [bacterium]|nr:NAD(P)-dependent oxidoreductase [bacterium]
MLSRTKEFWETLRGERLFITGGTGFFGRWLLESFLWANQQLHLKAEAVFLSRDPERFKKISPLATHPSISFHKGDVRNFSLPEGSFSHLIHAATEASDQLNRENPSLMLETIVEGTKRTLELAEKSGTKKLLFISSGAVYGRQPSNLTHIPEDYKGVPEEKVSAYAEGKRAAEKLVIACHKKSSIETKIARCFAFVGPYLPLSTHFAIGNFIQDLLKKEPIRIKGDGTPYRSYLYAAELAVWLWTLLYKGTAGEIYNVGSSEDLTIKGLAEKVAQEGEKIPVIIETPLTPGKAVERYVPSVKKIERDLGLRQEISLNSGIRKTVQWAKNL